MQQFVKTCGITSFVADGCNVDEVYRASAQAVEYTRTLGECAFRAHHSQSNTPVKYPSQLFTPTPPVHPLGRPSILLLEGLPRRFGHAASDRQMAYMTEQVHNDNNL